MFMKYVKEMIEREKLLTDLKWKVVKYEINGFPVTVMALTPTREATEIIACRLSLDDKDVFYTIEML